MTHFIQGAVLAYAQSDEISLLLKDWTTFETQQWFGGKIQKIASISAAMASTAFYTGMEMYHHDEPITLQHRPLFDSRVFNVPMEEVANYFVWRQKDAIRNSVNMYAQYHFSHKQLQGKNIQDVKDMLTKTGTLGRFTTNKSTWILCREDDWYIFSYGKSRWKYPSVHREP